PIPLEQADVLPRRVPVPVLRPPLDLCRPSGVVLDGTRRVLIAEDRGGVADALATRLAERGTAVVRVSASGSEDATAQVNAVLAGGPIHGVFWLPALDVEPDPEALDLAGWRAVHAVRTKALYATLKRLVTEGPGPFLVSATRLGGVHGYDATGPYAPAGAAVVGCTKAYAREQAEALVKAVDVAASAAPAAVADLLVAEALSDPAIVEVGHRDGLRFGISLDVRPSIEPAGGVALGSETVFVITGAAGGVTSAVVADLAAASGGIFHLVDLAPAPRRDSREVHLFRTDRETLKREIVDALKATGDRPKPRDVDRRLMAVEREEAALSAVEAVEAAGGRATWHGNVDLRDAAAVGGVLDAVRQAHGRVDVMVHAAGLEVSRRLEDKDPAEFDLVFDVKVDGFHNLIAGARDMPVGALVVFSSVAGRFGNQGQTDYSAANDLLAKETLALAARKGLRGAVLDWTAWDRIGMATRGSIPTIMKAAGIDMLQPEVGVPTVRRELVRGDAGGEVVVGGALGALMTERDTTGGLDPGALAAWLERHGLPRLMIGTIRAARLYGGIEVETRLDPTEQPFLFDHKVEKDVPWLPGVMGIESFAEAARLFAPHLHVVSIRDVHFESPFKFHRNRPRTLLLDITPALVPGNGIVARAVLRSVTQARADLPPREQVHFSAEVHLDHEAPPVPHVDFTRPNGKHGRAVGKNYVYEHFFHGPSYQVLDKAWVRGDRVIGAMSQADVPHTAPADTPLATAPLALELCFQAASLWQIRSGRPMGLPRGVEKVVIHPPNGATGPVHAVVTARDGGSAFDGLVVDPEGRVLVEVEGYRTVEVPS
ncbi:MAG: SDR family oxidoreductase, partial [Deltaproteobacteria bacterium]|nr:SDR family oxidoreductase [Deltaproteobacteria bacterium]